MAAINTELNNLFNQIEQFSGSTSSTTSSAKSSLSYDEIAWFSNTLGALGSEDSSSEQKATATQGLVQKALSLFDKLASREAQAAQKEVTKETTQSQQLLQKSQQLSAVLEGKFTDISSNIEQQSEIVSEANELIAETQKSLEEKQKEIEEIVAQIETKQKELAAASTPQEQAEILAEIQGFAQQIADIGTTIKADNENLKNLTTAVEDTTKDIETATQNMTVIEQEGIGQITQLAQDASQNGADISQTAATGTTNKATSVAAEKSAKAASSNVFSGTSIAPKLYQVSNDQAQASSTRLSSIATNINTISQGIGNLSNSTQIISSFQTSIGSAINDYAGLIGSWETAVEPVITSLGSFTNIAKGASELNQAVETDLGTIGFEADQNGEVKQNNSLNKYQQENQSDNNQDNTQQELETPKFDIKKLSFGL